MNTYQVKSGLQSNGEPRELTGIPLLSGLISADSRGVGRTTPSLIRAGLVAAWLGAFLYFAAVLWGANSPRAGIQHLGKDSGPSIILTQHLKAALADMDANAVNVLLLPNGQSAQYTRLYMQRRAEFAQCLISAAQNITYGDAERVPIITLQTDVGTFEGLLAQARLLHQQDNDPAAVESYRAALRMLQTRLQPAADALDKANNDELNRAYVAQRGHNIIAMLVLASGTLLALIPLIWLQIFLGLRTRRTFNLGLLAATFLVLTFSGFTAVRFYQAGAELRRAKQDAFDSVRALWLARAVAYDANSDESRWLLDDREKPKLQAAFFSKVQQLVSFADGENYASLLKNTQNGTIPAGDKGYFVDELRNITFPGEQDAAIETVKAYSVYFGMDAEIRRLENSGQHERAVAFCVSYKVNESNWAYSQFDTALTKTIDINERAFQDAVARGFGAVSGFQWFTPLVILMVAVLTGLGVKPRLEEYKI